MNCISFANLAISIWCTGNAHAHPYNPSQADGGFTAVGSRYGLNYLRNPALPAATKPAIFPSKEPMDYFHDYTFYSTHEVLAVVDPTRLYYLQWCYRSDTEKKYVKKVYDKDTKKWKQTKETVIQPAGFGHHDTVLYNGNVYEINTFASAPYVRETPFKKRASASPDVFRVMGPV